MPAPSPGSLGIYLHVPFCARRCGYCDFNTYTARELGGTSGLGNQDSYADTAIREIDWAARALEDAGARRPASTVFFGGGTPTLLPADDLARMLNAVRDLIGLEAGAEITTEANPDSVDARYLAELAAAGFTRVSFGMQSARPHVLAALDRTHDPARVTDVVRGARHAGLAVSLDLIYGAHGETLDDWRASLDAATALQPDHVSAYALVVEAGTPLARRVAHGELTAPDEDDLAAKYELADDVLSAAGYAWYEVSNWARTPEQACRHNVGYWNGDDWWGIGPGAHSHLAGRRWWNVRHPRTYAERLAAGTSPAEGEELLDDDARYTERVLLGVRLAQGLPIAALRPAGRAAVAALIGDGLVDGAAAIRGDVAARRLVLTRRGRLLADAVVRMLLD
ncbi:MAG: radical SAM family heme chaperone HemW [Kineosporiaceae bacterium]